MTGSFITWVLSGLRHHSEIKPYGTAKESARAQDRKATMSSGRLDKELDDLEAELQEIIRKQRADAEH